MDKKKRPRPAPLLRLPGVMLDATAVTTAEDDAPTWIQIARTGLWKGYRAGQVEFTRQMLDTMVQNFRSNPAYQRGADGWGEADVVPWDFNHASEMDPTLGELPVLGAPAQAWTLDLDVRPGTDPQTFELWSLTRLLEPVRGYIADGKIKWASVGVWKSAVDPVSGKDIGPLLTSVAFTNNPFIQGMAPIAARMDYYVGRATDAEDALCQIKGLLGLPQLASVGDVQIELAKLKMWLDQGQVPIGVDADEIVAGLRTILGLPALSPSDQVFAELLNLVPALVDQQVTESAEAPAYANLPPDAGPPMMTSNPPGASMDPKKFITLASVLGLAATTPEDQVIHAARQAMDAAAKLGPLLKALGVEDADGAISKITSLMKQAADLEAAMPELKSLREEKKTKDAEAETTEVGNAIAAHNLPDKMKDALLLLRRTDVTKFREQFPLPGPGERHLTRTLFADGNGNQFGSEKSGAAPQPGRVALTGVRGGGGVPTEEDLAQFPGPNITMRAMEYVRQIPGCEKLGFDAVHERASRIVMHIREQRQAGATRR